MKKIVGGVLAALLLVAGFTGCASTKNNANALGGVAQAQKSGLPAWAYYGCTFTSKEADGFLANYKPSDSGLFAEGEALRADARTSQIAARLDARANLASFVKTEAARYAADNGLSTDQVNVEEIDQILVGSRIVDSVKGPDDTYYVLMFISDKDLKESAKQSPTLKNLIDAITAERLEELYEEAKTSE